MSVCTLPPPPPPVCLTRSYKSRDIKGGTVIDEATLDLETHRRKLLDPDDYRKCVIPCRACGEKILHAHCFRDRTLRGASAGELPLVVAIRLYFCASKTCGAVFTVLPAIIARHLWRQWKTVEEVTSGKLDAPRATARRWLSRLKTDTSQLVQVITAKAGTNISGNLLRLLSKVTTRASFLEAMKPSGLLNLSHFFALLTSWIHRLMPGIRLM